MKSKKQLYLAIIALLALAGCDSNLGDSSHSDSSSSAVVDSSNSSTLSSSSDKMDSSSSPSTEENSSVEDSSSKVESGLTLQDLEAFFNGISTTHNYTVVDYYTNSIQYYTENAYFDDYSGYGYMDLSGSVYEYSLDSLSNIQKGKKDSSLTSFDEVDALAAFATDFGNYGFKVTSTGFSSNDKDAIAIFAAVGGYTSYASYVTSVTVSVSNNVFSKDGISVTLEGLGVEMDITDVGVTTLDASDFAKNYVAASYTSTLPSSALTSLSSKVKATTALYSYETSNGIDKTYEENLTEEVVFDGEYYSNVEKDATGAQTYFASYKKGTDGFILSQTLSRNNTADYTALEYEYDENCANIVNTLQTNNFGSNDGVTYVMKDASDNVDEVVSSLVGYNMEVYTCSLTLTDGSVSALTFKSFETFDEEEEVYYAYSGTIQFDTSSSVAVATITPYVTESYHATLKAALDALTANNYSVSLDYTSSSNVKTNYGLLKVSEEENASVTISEGYYPDGQYVCDGMVIPFYHDTDENVVYEQNGAFEGSFADVVVDYGVAAELFEKTGDYTYVLKEGVSQDVAFSLVNLYYDLENEITDLTVTLNASNAISSVSFDSAGYHFVETFSAVGSTTVGISFENMVAFVMPTSWAEYDASMAALMQTSYGATYTQIPFMYADEWEFDEDYDLLAAYATQDEVDAYIALLETSSYTFVEENSYGVVYSNGTYEIEVDYYASYGLIGVYITVL